MFLRCVLAVIALAFQTVAQAEEQPAAPPFELRDGDRVVFLGNTFFERAQKYGYIEAALTTRYPDRQIIFRNLGWDGDTVWAESRGMFDPPEVGYKRMLEQIAGIKPTVIFLAYGNNEAFAGMEGLPAFVKQYEKLLDDLTAASAEGVRFVLVAPLPMEPLPVVQSITESHNAILDRYVDALRSLALRREIDFLDLYSPWKKIDSILGGNGFQIEMGRTLDGRQIHAAGYWGIAEFFPKPPRDPRTEPCFFAQIAADGTVSDVHHGKVMNVKRTAKGLQFNVMRNFLPTPLDPRIPPPELESSVSDAWQRLGIKGLPRGRYELRIDGVPVHQATAAKWAGFEDWYAGPDFEQAEQLRQAIIEKNRLYFHHWRPQNITYLFGFRKHEQGQNAKEVAEFEQLVAEKEREIARLKTPVTRTYELVPVKKPPEK